MKITEVVDTRHLNSLTAGGIGRMWINKLCLQRITYLITALQGAG